LVNEGWPGLTHRKVAQQAEAPLGLVRYHFGNLAGLHAAIAEQVSHALIGPMTDELVSTTSVEELIAVFLTVLETGREEPTGIQLLIQIMVGTAYYPDISRIVRTDLDGAKAHLAAHLQELDPEWTAPSALQAASLLIATCDGILLHALVDPSAGDQHSRSQLHTMLQAILVPPRTGDPTPDH
jgi:AcrR family transcriptional regulator